MKKICVIVVCVVFMAGLCFAEWETTTICTLEVHAKVDDVPGYCDSILHLVGADPAPGTYFIPLGDTVNISIDSTIISTEAGVRDSCYCWSATGAPCSSEDTCYGMGALISFALTENTTLIWHFKRQFLFEVACTSFSSMGCPFDSPVPDYGEYWIDSGDEITASVDVHDGDFICVGYYGSGSVPFAGWGTSMWCIVGEPSSITWRVVIVAPICSVFVASTHAEAECTPTLGWFYSIDGAIATLSTAPFDEPDSLVGIRYNCIGWAGTGCVPETGPTPYEPPYNVCTVTCTTSGTIEWLWEEEIYEILYTLCPGWNLIGGPIGGMPAATLYAYPSVIPPVYLFESGIGYSAADSLVYAIGYWVLALDTVRIEEP